MHTLGFQVFICLGHIIIIHPNKMLQCPHIVRKPLLSLIRVRQKFYDIRSLPYLEVLPSILVRHLPKRCTTRVYLIVEMRFAESCPQEILWEFLGEDVPLGLWNTYPFQDHVQLHFATLFQIWRQKWLPYPRLVILQKPYHYRSLYILYILKYLKMYKKDITFMIKFCEIRPCSFVKIES